MSYLTFYNSSRKEKKLVFQEAADQVSLPAYAVEKIGG